MMNKKGIELTINFIVTLIIILVIFVASVMITRNFFLNAEDIQNQLDQQTIDKIQQILNNEDNVVIFEPSRTIPVKDGALFGLGIWNIGSNAASNTFDVNVKCTKALNRDDEILNLNCGSPDEPCGGCMKLLYSQSWTISNGEKVVDSIYIEPIQGAKTGTYVFDVNICKEGDLDLIGDCDGKDDTGILNKDELYDGIIHKITVVVP